MIRFANVDLLLETPETRAFIESAIPHSRRRLWGADWAATYRSTTIPQPNYPAPPEPRVNVLHWPTGAARWGHGLFLCNGEQLQRILDFVGGSSDDENNPAQLVLTDSGFSGDPDADGWTTDEFGTLALSVEMYLLPPRPVSSLIDRVKVEERLWLLPLVDERYYWHYQNTGSTWAPESWNDALDDIADIVTSGNLSRDDVDSAYQGLPDEWLEWKVEDAALVFDAIALRNGMHITRKFDGLTYVNRPGTAQSDLNENLSRLNPHDLAGGDFSSRHPQSAIPATFVAAYPDGEGGYSVESVDATGGNSTDLAEQAVKLLEPSTSANKATIAAQMAADYYTWLESRYDYVFGGLYQWEPCGFDDAVEIEFGALRADGGYSVTTRAATLPYNFGALDFFTRGGSGGSTCEAQNELHQVMVAGSPTGGSFSLSYTINSVSDDVTVAYDDTAAEVKTALETHSEVSSGDVAVTGGPLPDATIQIEFKATYAETPIGIPIASWASLTGGTGVVVITSRVQTGSDGT